MNKTGKVYKITSPSGRIYIGSTSTNIDKRWSYYKNKTCKSQIKLFRSLEKHGVDNHKFEVIWEGDVIDMLKNERLLGEKFDVLSENGLNCRLPGYDDVSLIWSDESKQKASKSRKGTHPSKETRIKQSLAKIGKLNPNYGVERTPERIKKHSDSLIGEKCYWYNKTGKDHPRSKSVNQFDLEGNFIKTWESASEAARELNISGRRISLCCNKIKYKKTGEYKWEYTK